MEPKYCPGMKVRIKAHDFIGRLMDPDIHQYENMTGEVVESTNIVAFIGSPWSIVKSTGEHITVYHYTIRISDEVVIRDVIEDCIEIV